MTSVRNYSTLVFNAVFSLTPCAAIAQVDEVKFAYTPANTDGCRLLDESEGGSTYRCAGLGGLDIEISVGDHSSVLAVVRGNTRLFAGPSLYNTTVRQNVVEWRYRGEYNAPRIHGLIYRLDDHNGAKVKSSLIAVRLAGRACVVGKTTSNEKARAMVDDPSRPCK